MEKRWTKMATIQKTYERAVEENLGISKNLIRDLSLSNQIPVVRVGNRTKLISWTGLIDFLENGTPTIETEENVAPGKIRKIL